MRWQPSSSWASSGRRAIARLVPVAGLAILATGCATVQQVVQRRPVGEEARFLVDPLVGFPASVSLDRPEQLREIHAALQAGRLDEARVALDALARSAPLSASVLSAELDLLESRFDGAAERLRPVVQQYPEYLAAQAVLGRAEERLGRIVEAYAAYRAAATLEVAGERAAALEPRVLEVLGQRVDTGLAQGRVEEAEAALRQLADWAPEARGTLERTVAVAGAKGEPTRELAALRRLTAVDPEDTEKLRRQAELEVDWGDPGTALRLYEELHTAHPDDPEVAAGLERAQGAFRLSLLPGAVQDLTGRPALTRGEFAGLVYWLMPSVRTSRGVGRIATDALESPYRREIVRVVNLELLGLDAAQHLFRPDRPVSRHDALLCFLRLAAKESGGARCLGGAVVRGAVPSDTVCSLAAGCDLLADAADCLPNAPVSGQETLTFARRVLGLGPRSGS
ncbi:MAG: tetratricopeptide repeat protein [Thermoanaerobaculia bacterium]